MVIGVCRIELCIVDALSLKDKRMVLRSIKDRLKTKFNIAIAEIDKNDNWRIAELGITCVSNAGSHADSILSNVINFLERDGRAQIIDYYTETIHV